ncbi:hypothetical protein [Stenotrophomonas geniculata]
MTQEHISHPEGLPNCAAGHRARHIHDKRCASAGGGHLVECACRSTSKHADAEGPSPHGGGSIAPRAARAAPAPTVGDNILQFQLGLADRPTKARRIGGHHGRG